MTASLHKSLIAPVKTVIQQGVKFPLISFNGFPVLREAHSTAK
jgi:hypothetical protein